MTKTDFAELKEKLTEFDSKKNFDEIMKETIGKNPHHKEVVLTFYAGSRNAGRNEQNTKNAAIISELIEIIQSQSEALEAQPRYDMSENPPRETYAFKTAQQSLSETTTRLQKLREGRL